MVVVLLWLGEVVTFLTLQLQLLTKSELHLHSIQAKMPNNYNYNPDDWTREEVRSSFIILSIYSF